MGSFGSFWNAGVWNHLRGRVFVHVQVGSESSDCIEREADN